MMVCELQSELQKTLITELEARCETESTGDNSMGSDDTALYQIGGWALFSAAKFRQQCIRQQRGDVEKLAEELIDLKALQLAHESKLHLPVGLRYLDRGGLTFPKEQLLPYLRKIEERMLEVLNDKNYRRYGQRLFEVRVQIGLVDRSNDTMRLPPPSRLPKTSLSRM